MQQIYRRTPVPKSDFNNNAKQLYWNYTSAWVISGKFTKHPFLRTSLDGCLWKGLFRHSLQTFSLSKQYLEKNACLLLRYTYTIKYTWYLKNSNSSLISRSWFSSCSFTFNIILWQNSWVLSSVVKSQWEPTISM